MAVEIHNRRTKIKYQPKSVDTIDADYSVPVFDTTGENVAITYDNLIAVLSTIFLVADDTRLYYGTSTTNLTIGGGVHVVTTQAGLGYTVGQRVRLSYSDTRYMEGYISDYTGTSLTFTCDYKSGTGSYNSWVLSPTTEQIVPDGGLINQVLTKASGTDYDVTWTTPATGSGGSNSDYNNSFFLMGG